VSRYQKGKTNLDFTEARESEWQWHQLGHMQVSTSLQTDNHASTPPLSFFTGQMPFLPPNQQRQSTEGKTVVIRTVNPYVDPKKLLIHTFVANHVGRFQQTLVPCAKPHTCLDDAESVMSARALSTAFSVSAGRLSHF